MFTNQRPAEWLRMCADMEHDGSITPAQVRTDAVVLEAETARAIGLTGIWRMTAEEVEAAMAAECCS